eukprot:765655-Amphidinium_carterae.3
MCSSGYETHHPTRRTMQTLVLRVRNKAPCPKALVKTCAKSQGKQSMLLSNKLPNYPGTEAHCTDCSSAFPPCYLQSLAARHVFSDQW